MSSLIRRMLALVATVALVAPVIVLEAQDAPGKIRGVVSDDSGAVIPGVTVTAALGDGRVVGSTVTDGSGVYTLDDLPVTNIVLTFALEGFSSGEARVLVPSGAEVQISQKLLLAPRNETVQVVANLPIPPPSRPPAAPPPPTTAPDPVPEPVPEHDRDSICGPAKPEGAVQSFGKIRARRGEAGRGLYVRGDVLMIEGGRSTGLDVGENYVVRRTVRVESGRRATVEHSAGLLQIVEVEDKEALAVVVYACDEFMAGDVLAAFKPEPARSPEPLGTPAFDDAATILFADIGQLMGTSRRLMVIDRGQSSNIRVGQTLTVFRQPKNRNPVVVGTAVVVAVRNGSATIRIDRAIDEISFGDFAAPQRYPDGAAAANGQQQ